MSHDTFIPCLPKADRERCRRRLRDLKDLTNHSSIDVLRSCMNPDDLTPHIPHFLLRPFNMGDLFMVSPHGWNGILGFGTSEKPHPGLVIRYSPPSHSCVQMAPGTTQVKNRSAFFPDSRPIADPGYQFGDRSGCFLLYLHRPIKKTPDSIQRRMGQLKKCDIETLQSLLSNSNE